MIVKIIIFVVLEVVVLAMAFKFGAEYTRKKIRQNLEKSYFGTMILNMNLKDNDHFVETRFNENPRELLKRDMVLFDIKIRE